MVALRPASFHPAAPLVVGKESAGDEEYCDDGEEELHKNRGQGSGIRDQGSGIRKRIAQGAIVVTIMERL
jgi:hypothetical protein